jgi:hypothetical protein
MSVATALLLLLAVYCAAFFVVFAVRFFSPKRKLKVKSVATWVEGTAWAAGFVAIAAVTIYKNW